MYTCMCIHMCVCSCVYVCVHMCVSMCLEVLGWLLSMTCVLVKTMFYISFKLFMLEPFSFSKYYFLN